MAFRAEASPRLASASREAARTSQLLSPADSVRVLVVSGSGSWTSTLAAAARTGEVSSLVKALIAPQPMPANGMNPIPSSKPRDRKSTRLNSSHGSISYGVFCLKKKNHQSMERSEQKNNE